ncbi:MAG: hypothetical protein AUJ75_00915 [Candidatus Omnitrophica bacterium CG1_02_49_10]|nr:MAG: hypothetical protein AUJ75_00915 [Candidatus Omnitrophica bacterium CG1_02_49_10]
MENGNIDEMLELIWTEEESGRRRVNDILNADKSFDRDSLEGLSGKGYVKLEGEDIILTPAGRAKASNIIRNHRLAERLLKDVLEVKTVELETQACEFEHILSSEVADAICTLLGHPKECPHGRKISQGACCKKAVKEVSSVIVPLADLRSSQSGKVAYIATTHHARLDRLTSLGIFPGVTIRVHQKVPTLVVQLDHMQIALDKDIAEDIFVRRG